MTTNEIKLKPIGFVHRLSKGENVKDRSLISEMVVHKRLAKALEGLEGFSHVYVLFFMHEISLGETKMLKVHPKGRSDLPLVGVFATRSAYRPNPVGLTLVQLIERKENVLVVKGLDALDGTPVLDVKLFDSWDVALDARVPEWHKTLHEKGQPNTRLGLG
jgi:tRNA-Thr(GGU) m(6)t(6)A37 methyltransferase TsaA